MRPLSNGQKRWLNKIKDSNKLNEFEQGMVGIILHYSRYDSDVQSKWLNKLRKRFLTKL